MDNTAKARYKHMESLVVEKKMSQNDFAVFRKISSRLAESAKHSEYYDDKGVFCFYNQKDLANDLGISSRTVFNCLSKLKKANILSIKRQGLNKPNKIYFGDISDSQFLQAKNGINCESRTETDTNQDLPKLQGNTKPKKDLGNLFNNNQSTDSVVQDIIKQVLQLDGLDEFTSDERALIKGAVRQLATHPSNYNCTWPQMQYLMSWIDVEMVASAVHSLAKAHLHSHAYNVRQNYLAKTLFSKCDAEENDLNEIKSSLAYYHEQHKST